MFPKPDGLPWTVNGYACRLGSRANARAYASAQLASHSLLMLDPPRSIHSGFCEVWLIIVVAPPLGFTNLFSSKRIAVLHFLCLSQISSALSLYCLLLYEDQYQFTSAMTAYTQWVQANGVLFDQPPAWESMQFVPNAYNPPGLDSSSTFYDEGYLHPFSSQESSSTSGYDSLTSYDNFQGGALVRLLLRV